KYKSPYAKASSKSSKEKTYFGPVLFGPDTPLQSVLVSRRSASPDCSTLQTASVQSIDGDSDVDSNSSNSTDNSCLSSPSKRNRPVHAAPGHFRYSPRKHYLTCDGRRAQPVFKQQPWVIRATAYKNGTKMTPVQISAPTIHLLLESGTEKLKLNMAARRVFLADGTEAFEPKDIPHDADVFISTGEPFLDPLKNVK
ncbi:hypothetical protein FKM82_030396, partial [Ascaphus truei]